MEVGNTVLQQLVFHCTLWNSDGLEGTSIAIAAGSLGNVKKLRGKLKRSTSEISALLEAMNVPLK
jgi:hypothetical protein